MEYYPDIYAVTVSKNYSQLLELSLEKNIDFFKKWYIITQDDDISTINLIKRLNNPKIELVLYPIDKRVTTLFHTKSLLTTKIDQEISIPTYLRHSNKSEMLQKEYDNLIKDGVKFDKGGGLRQVQKYILPKLNLKSDNDFILILDSDIILPKNFKETIVNSKLELNIVYTCQRKNYIFYSDYEKDNGHIDKNTLVGAGFFHLYRYDPSKLCKRSYTAGWVDWEFKDQFSKCNLIEGLTVSHLGEPDINWSGKKGDTFLMDDQINDYCRTEDLKISSDLEISKQNIRNRIRATRLNTIDRKLGVPNYYLFGSIYSGVNELYNFLKEDSNISFFQQTYGNLSFFGNASVKNELWNKNFTFYLKSFPKITDHKWMDQIEFDLFDHKTTILIKKRLKLFFNEKLLRCGEFRFPKIIYCYRDPLNRMIVQYEKYVQNFPASFNWNWKAPTASLEKNIMLDDQNLDSSSSFISNSNLSSLLLWIIYELGMKHQNIFLWNADDTSIEQVKRLENFIDVDLQNKVYNLDEDVKSSINQKYLSQTCLDITDKYFKSQLDFIKRLKKENE